jgi:putative aldouronate transport system permease protein
MIRDRSVGSKLFTILNYLFLGGMALLCLLPLIHVLAVSLSDRASNTGHLVFLWPINFNTYNYVRILENQQFLQSLNISLWKTIGGTIVNIGMILITAYPLSRREEFAGKRFFRWMLIFAMLFGGGLIPWFLAMNSLGLVNNLLGLILPGMVPMFYILVMTNFYRTIPEELAESAMVDGASYWTILWKIYVPLSTPAIATLILFNAVDHWNSWFDALVLMRNVSLYPLQTYLQSILITSHTSSTVIVNPQMAKLLSERAMQGAQIILTTLPILVVYPFVQRYFVSGLTLGAVKG